MVGIHCITRLRWNWIYLRCDTLGAGELRSGRRPPENANVHVLYLLIHLLVRATLIDVSSFVYDLRLMKFDDNNMVMR